MHVFSPIAMHDVPPRFDPDGSRFGGTGSCRNACSEFEEEPAEFFCVTPDGGRGEACVSLYLDEDGYEVCLFDEVGKTEHCTSYYGRPDRGEGTFGVPELSSPIGLIDC